jgi:hypothetical protein
MDIKNVTQFVNLLVERKMQPIHPSFNGVIICLEDYRRLCGSCGKTTYRDKVYANCNEQYEHIVKHVLPGFASQFFANTNETRANFYKDGDKLVGVLSR